MSKQHFEEVKRDYPNTAKALGITEGMDFEEWREQSTRQMLQRLMQPPRIDPSQITQSDSTTPLPRRWQVWYSNSTNPKE